jgi:orotidine-5'-phosphate decarboxylase
VSTLEAAAALVKDLAPYVGCFKIGLELLTAVGAPAVMEMMRRHEAKVFYDGKFDDIPNTVGKASKAVANMGVAMFNVHASAGVAAMQAAVQSKKNSLVLAVTVLTSLSDLDARHTFGRDSLSTVFDFAIDAVQAGCDGVICSPQELKTLHSQQDTRKLLKVTPGVRPTWAAVGDQKRVMTPGEAVKAGADYLVIGRPITNPPPEIGSPVAAAIKIAEEIEAALS